MRTRGARRLAARRERVEFIRLPGSLKPFKRAFKLHQEFIDTLAKHAGDLPIDRQIAVSALKPYVSRGHGGRHRPKQRVIGGAWSRDRSRYAPAEEDRKHSQYRPQAESPCDSDGQVAAPRDASLLPACPVPYSDALKSA